MFFDFETKLDRQINKHVVNYCIVHDFNGTKNIFTCIGDFCKWAFVKKHKGYTFIAHYGKGYNFQIHCRMVNRSWSKTIHYTQRQKIIQLEVKFDYKIRFLDNISFTLMPLRDFPKTFGLKELAKGYFPDTFNTDDIIKIMLDNILIKCITDMKR